MSFSDIVEKFYDPFSCIKKDGNFSIEGIFRPLYGQPETSGDCGDFPFNIYDVIWYQEGENRQKDWIMFCQLSSGMYAYYSAWCDNSGFECQGGMCLYVSASRKILIEMAMTDDERIAYREVLEIGCQMGSLHLGS